MDAFTVSGVRITHQRADVGDLETARYDDPGRRIEELLDHEGVTEAAVLQTCNRVEEYVVTESPETGEEALAAFPSVPDEAVVEMSHTESLRHLLRVAAGLESQVLGEDQILGQIRDAYGTANDHDGLGRVLDPAFLKAIHVGERARAETEINEGTVSLGSAAINLAERERGLRGTVLVVGAGEMARTVAKALPESADLRIVNRSLDNAKRLAADVAASVECARLDALDEHLGEADVVVSTTGSDEPVIDVDTAGSGDGTLVIDLGQPRDVSDAAADESGIEVHDLDDLRSVTEATHEDRREAARAVEDIVEEEFGLLIEQYKRRRADAVIAAMYEGGERIKDRELSRALGKLDELDEEDREVIESLAESLVSQLLAVPTKSLRDAAAEDDWETIATALELFDPKMDADVETFFDTKTDGKPADAGTEE